MILVTGATGFIGRAVVARVAGEGERRVRAAARRAAPLPMDAEATLVGEVDGATDWTRALSGVDVVVHLAARVHAMRDVAPDSADAYRRVNVSGTLCLARQAVSAGVRRLVFLSSAKVNGESTAPGLAFTAGDEPAPDDDYSRSKYEAEVQLRRLAGETGLDVVIIRPVLVYGPGVKANFRTMMRWLYRGIPLPFGAIRNRRSLVALDNLVDLIARCLDAPEVRNETLLVSDGEDLSTPELLHRTAEAMGRKARLISVPAPVVIAVARLLGAGDVAQRLCASHQVDITKTRQLLGWAPPVSVEESLGKTVGHFLAEVRGGGGRAR